MEFDLNELLIVIVRAYISLITLFLITKMLGKKQVSQLSLFDYVIGISIGNFAAEITINFDSSLIYGIVSVLIFGTFAYTISILTMKSIKIRRFFIGVPTVLIDKGQILEKGLKKVKFDINDLLEECRGNGYFDLNEIDYAIMEVNGKVSIMPKQPYKPITLKDMNLKESNQSLCANVIIDSNIMENNLKNMNKYTNNKYYYIIKEEKMKDSYWILSSKNNTYETLDKNEKFTVYEKNNDKPSKNVLE